MPSEEESSRILAANPEWMAVRVQKMFSCKTKYRPDRHDEGFTLVELMVAVTVLGIILALVVLNWGGITRDNSLAAAQKQVEGALKRAKTAATQENVTYIINFYASGAYPDSYAFWRPRGSSPENKAVAGESVTDGYISIGTGVQVVSDVSFTFTPAGTMLTATPGTVNLEMGGDGRSVSVDSNGRITI
jgi:prepilin-type N-terminal cleavage/methylation domain-containing protein